MCECLAILLLGWRRMPPTAGNHFLVHSGPWRGDDDEDVGWPLEGVDLRQ